MLTYPDTGELFTELAAKYALRSGISGVQPKILLDASDRGVPQYFHVRNRDDRYDELHVRYGTLEPGIISGYPIDDHGNNTVIIPQATNDQ